MEFRNATLSNGLEIIAECNPKAYSLGMAFFVKTGSRDETDEVSGVSHFLEHMVFKGTARRSAADVNRELDELGSHSNAYTSEEQTVYYATVLPEFQDRCLELLSDMMRPALREDDFNTEKKVIIEEIAKYDDQPPYGGHEKSMALYFGQHPLSRSVLGTAQSVGALTAEQMRGYFEQRYSPRNMAIAAAGNVDFDRLVSEAERWCGSWKPFDAPRATPRAPAKTAFQVIKSDLATQEYVISLSDGPAATDPERYAARLLATILGDDSGSRLYWELVDSGLADFCGTGASEYQGTGLLWTYMCCQPEDCEENLQRIRDVYVKAEQDGITEKELEQAKNKICSHLVLQAERPSSRLFSVGNGWLQRREYRTVREAVEAYRAVQIPDLHAILKKYPLTRSATLCVGPLETVAEPK
jgi:predicted Zn-dependent peptidase